MSEKIKDIMKEVDGELLEDKLEVIKPIVKDKKKEIELARRTLEKLQKEYEELLDTDIDELYYNEEIKDDGTIPGLQYGA
jgi:hypothetical protein